jgi:hypothetical protein
MKLIATIGRRKIKVTSWAQISKVYLARIAELDVGSSAAPLCDIKDTDGQAIAHVSYNGAVWSGPTRQPWDPNSSPLYKPWAV